MHSGDTGVRIETFRKKADQFLHKTRRATILSPRVCRMTQQRIRIKQLFSVLLPADARDIRRDAHAFLRETLNARKSRLSLPSSPCTEC
jgi:hypothetical protein